MRGRRQSLGALASLGLMAALATAAVAQVPERVIKLQRADGPVPDPTPAPGARFAKEPAVGPEAENVRAASAPAAPVAPAAAGRAGAMANANRVARGPVIGSHQIDRYDALQKEQKAVKDNPKSLADWIILGELAHEVAMDAPADQAGKYFDMARDAFENAQRLAPDNSGLKAAVQFARDQQKNMDQFEKSRDEYTDTFLAARRRDLEATGNTPYVKIYEPPLPSRTLPGPATTATANATATTAPASSPAAVAPTAVAPPSSAAAEPTVEAAPPGRTPAGGTRSTPPPATPAAAVATARATTDPNIDSATTLVRSNNVPVAEATPAVTPAPPGAPATDAANYGTQQNYSAAPPEGTYSFGPRYLPFASPDGVPYTYQQYSNAYFPRGVYNNPTAVPITPQRYVTPVVVPNAFERQILNRASGAAPAPVPVPVP